MTFAASGEVRISGCGHVAASPAGAGEANPSEPAADRADRRAHWPGRQRTAVLIGNQTRVQAPAAGQLFLGVNDSHLADNQGNFQVEVRRITRSRVVFRSLMMRRCPRTRAPAFFLYAAIPHYNEQIFTWRIGKTR